MKLALPVPLVLSLLLPSSAAAQEERSTGPATALTGALFALEALHAATEGGEWEVHRLSSDLVFAPGEDATPEERAAFAPHVRVELDLSAFAGSGSAAETAFELWETRLSRASEEADGDPWGYRRMSEVWLKRGLESAVRAKQRAGDATAADRSPSGTHRSAMVLEIPADQVRGFPLPGGGPGSGRGDVKDPSGAEERRSPDPTTWLRSVAQRKRVLLGKVTIRAYDREQDDRDRWVLTAPAREEAGIDMVRAANFLYLTSTETQSVVIDSLEIRRVPDVGLHLRVGYAEATETD